MNQALQPALLHALRLHEIGSRSPYEISFAGKGKSGASFGFMQGDMAQGAGIVRETFALAMQDGGVAADVAAGLAARLAVPLTTCPLSEAERDQVNAALLAGRARVDAMDKALAGRIYTDLDACLAEAGRTARTLAPEALIYIALWSNMTGYPGQVIAWLGGGRPRLRRPVAPAGSVVDAAALETYLLASDYFIENPHNWPQMVTCAAAGVALLPA